MLRLNCLATPIHHQVLQQEEEEERSPCCFGGRNNATVLYYCWLTVSDIFGRTLNILNHHHVGKMQFRHEFYSIVSSVLRPVTFDPNSQMHAEDTREATHKRYAPIDQSIVPLLTHLSIIVLCTLQGISRR